MNAADEKRRAFGPEWKRTDSQSVWAKLGFDYERNINITVHHSQGNVAGFSAPLECGDLVMASEIDDNAGSNVEIRPHEFASPYGGFEVRKDEKGAPESYSVTVGPNLYFDLNADGILDAMFDKRDGRVVPMILFEGRFIPVRRRLALFNCARGETLKVRGIEGTDEYEFTKGCWNRVK